MIRYLLDTNIVSDLIRNPRGKVAKKVRTLEESSICTSIIVAAEMRYGCAKKGPAWLLKVIEDVLKEIEVLPFEHPADIDYGSIRTELEVAGTRIGANDMLIAAHARSLGAVLVTANFQEFKRVSGLRVENWLA